MSHKSNTESEFECQSKRFVLSQQRGLQQSYCQKMHEKVHRRRCDNQKKSTDCSIVANQNDITTKIIIMSDINRLTSQRIDDDEMSTSPVYRRSRPQHKQQQQEYVPQEKKVSKCPIVVDSTTTTKSLRSRFHEPMFLNMRMPTLSLLFSQMLLLILILEIPLQSSAIAAANAPQLKHTTALNNRPPPNAKGHIHYKTTYACEGNSLELTCDDSKSIHLVRANYGRFSLTICNDAGNPTFSVNCMSFRSYLLMQDRCSHQSNCSVIVSSSMFGDPCPGTAKYLEVQYYCSERGNGKDRSRTQQSMLPVTISPNLTTTAAINSIRSSGSPTSTSQSNSTAYDTNNGAANNLPTKWNEQHVSSASRVADTRDNGTAAAVGAAPLAPPSGDDEQQQQQQPWQPASGNSEPSSNGNEPTCAPVAVRDVQFGVTQRGAVVRVNCPPGAAGTISWQCDYASARWTPTNGPDFSECRSLWLENLDSQLASAIALTLSTSANVNVGAASSTLARQSLAVRTMAELALMTRTKQLFGADVRRVTLLVVRLLDLFDARLSTSTSVSRIHSSHLAPLTPVSSSVTSSQQQLRLKRNANAAAPPAFATDMLSSVSTSDTSSMIAPQLLNYVADVVSGLLDPVQRFAWQDIKPLALRQSIATQLLASLKRAATMVGQQMSARSLRHLLVKSNVLVCVTNVDMSAEANSNNNNNNNNNMGSKATKSPVRAVELSADTLAKSGWSKWINDDTLTLPQAVLNEIAEDGVAKVAIIAVKRLEEHLDIRLASSSSRADYAGHADDVTSNTGAGISSTPVKEATINSIVFGSFAIGTNNDESDPNETTATLSSNYLSVYLKFVTPNQQPQQTTTWCTRWPTTSVTRSGGAAAAPNNGKQRSCWGSWMNTTNVMCHCNSFGYVVVLRVDTSSDSLVPINNDDDPTATAPPTNNVDPSLINLNNNNNGPRQWPAGLLFQPINGFPSSMDLDALITQAPTSNTQSNDSMGQSRLIFVVLMCALICAALICVALKLGAHTSSSVTSSSSNGGRTRSKSRLFCAHLLRATVGGGGSQSIIGKSASSGSSSPDAGMPIGATTVITAKGDNNSLNCGTRRTITPLISTTPHHHHHHNQHNSGMNGALNSYVQQPGNSVYLSHPAAMAAGGAAAASIATATSVCHLPSKCVVTSSAVPNWRRWLANLLQWRHHRGQHNHHHHSMMTPASFDHTSPFHHHTTMVGTGRALISAGTVATNQRPNNGLVGPANNTSSASSSSAYYEEIGPPGGIYPPQQTLINLTPTKSNDQLTLHSQQQRQHTLANFNQSCVKQSTWSASYNFSGQHHLMSTDSMQQQQPNIYSGPNQQQQQRHYVFASANAANAYKTGLTNVATPANNPTTTAATTVCDYGNDYCTRFAENPQQ